MSGYRHLLIILCALFLSASIVSAKVYWLPVYLGDNNDRSNVSEKDTDKDGIVSGNEGSNRGCPNGWLSSSEKGDKICVAKGSFPWVGVCYGDCVCDTSKYQYTSANCFGTKAPSGDECNDGTLHYKECIDACDLVTGKTNCSYGCKTTYAAEGCPSECKECYVDNCHNRTDIGTCTYGCETYFSDCSTKCQKCYADNCRNRTNIGTCTYGCETYFSDCSIKCQKCYTDNCHNRTDIGTCTYGCETYFSDCSTKCQKCYTDNCRNRTDNTTSLGCVKYWQDCSSKCEVGKTCVPNDCTAFTLSSCPANASCDECSAGCGDNTKKYKLNKCILGYYAVNGVCKKIEGVIGLRYNITASNGTITFAISDTDSNSKTGAFTIYWGDGVVESFNGKRSVSHTYNQTGDFDIVLDGDIAGFRTSGETNANLTHLLSLNLPGVTSYYRAFENKTSIISSIPELPSSLIYASSMFYKCENLTGNFPSLPPNLIYADYMFYDCGSSLEGSIAEFPKNLESATSMFERCYNLSGNIPDLPVTLTHANSMFMYTNLSGKLPAIPPYLEDGAYMFAHSGALTGNIDVEKIDTDGISRLPETLKYAHYMFAGCGGLTGDIPILPQNLEFAHYMFQDCSGLDGTINYSNLENTKITDGDNMFDGCTHLQGEFPKLPENLTTAKAMFSECYNLKGKLPELPKNLENGRYMFYRCQGIEGGLPETYPESLIDAAYMFSDSCISGEIKSLP